MDGGTMTNRSKARGTAFETAVVNYLRDNGFPNAERRALNGNQDRGDIAGIDGWCLELKSCKAFTPAEWMNEATVEASNAGVRKYAVVAKRRMKSTAEAYAILPLWLLVSLIDSAQRFLDGD